MLSSLGLRARLAVLVLLALLPVSALLAWDLLQGRTSTPQVRFAVLLLAALAGVALAWWLGGRVIAAPVRAMLQVADKVGAGQLDARVEVSPTRRGGELGLLGRSLNRMAESIAQRQFALDIARQDAEKNHALLDLIVNSMAEGVIAADNEGRFLLFNAAARRFFPLHADNDSVDGWRHWHELLTPDGAAAIAPAQRPLALAARGESVDNLEVLVRMDDTPDRVVSCNVRPLRDGGGQQIGGLVVFTDITERNAVRTLGRRQEQVLELVASGAPLEDALVAVARLVEAHIPACLCSVLLVQDGRLRLGAAPSLPEAFNSRINGLPIGPQGGACGTAAAKAQAVTVVDIAADPLMAPYRETADIFGLRACWSTPVVSGGGEVLGTFAVYYREVHRPAGAEFAVVDAAARMVRIVIERDRTVQALRISAARFRELAETVRDVFYVRDTASARLLYISPAAATLWGEGNAPPGPLTGDYLQVVHVDDRALVEIDLERQHRGEATAREFRIIRADGTQCWVLNEAYPVVNVDGVVERIVGTVRDITAHKQAQLRLAWTNRALQMLSHCNGALVRLDDESLLLGEVCRLAVEVGGFRMAWVGYARLGRESRIEPMAHAGEERGYLGEIQLSWRDDEPPGQGPAGRTVRSGKAVVCEDVTAQGSGFHWHDAAASRGYRSLVCLPLREAGQTFGLLALYGAEVLQVDDAEVRLLQELADNLAYGIATIRGRRQSREQIRRLTAALEQRVRQRTAQLEAANHELEAFSYSVAHDLRSPLAAIDGFSAALERLGVGDAGAAGERAAHYLGRVRASVKNMSGMIDALLSLAQLARASLRWEEVDLSVLAQGVVASLREHEPRRQVQVNIQPGLLATGDPRLLRMALENLLGNAWKFSAGQSEAKIGLSREPGDGGEPVWAVRDNGVGFDMTYAGKLFGAFQRLHAAHEFPGTGLGLANVQRIVSRHGGRIWARSAPGEGATFFFTLGSPPDQ